MRAREEGEGDQMRAREEEGERDKMRASAVGERERRDKK